MPTLISFWKLISWQEKHTWLKVATNRSAFYAVVKYHEPDVEMECIIRLQNELYSATNPVLKLNTLLHQIGVNFQHDHNPVLKLNALQSKFVSIWSTV